MNNSNRNTNRRRGRGSNRQQGGQQLNRIDSRARGNAQQMLDKYRKMAHDAHLNGDRVQEEYYLQFSDHYFRVLADQRQRQEETRVRRDGPLEAGERGRYDEPRSRYDYDDVDESGEDEQSQPEARDQRGDARERGHYDADASASENGSENETEGREGDSYEPTVNPFVRDNRGARGPARSRGPRRDSRNDDADEPARREEQGNRLEAILEPSVLPPPIRVSSDVVAEEAPAKPRRRTRKPRDTDGDDGSFEALG